MRDLFVTGCFDGRDVGIAGMEREPAARLGFNMEVEVELFCFRKDDLVREIPWTSQR